MNGYAICTHADIPVAYVQAAVDLQGFSIVNVGSDIIFPVTPLPGIGAETSGEGPGDFDNDDFDGYDFHVGPNPWLGYGGSSSDPDLAFSFQDSRQCTLAIGGVEVDLRSSSRYNLEDWQVTYDGKFLNFSEIATPLPVNFSFSLNAPVTMTLMVTPTGGSLATQHVYFTGRIRQRQHIGQNNGEAITYQAIGTQQLAFEQQLTLNGLPFFVIQPTEIYTYEIPGAPGIRRSYIGRTKDVIQTLFTMASSGLAALSIPSTFGNPGPETLTSFTTQAIDFQNVTFGEAIKQILQNEPNRRCFFDDLTGKWIFPDLTTLPIAQLDVSQVNLLENVYSWDMSNRYTAVKLVGKLNYEVSGAIKATQNTKEPTILTPAWDTALELDWTIQKAYGVQEPENFNEEYQWVYRRWLLPGNLTSDRNKKIPGRVWALVEFGQSLQYIPLDAYIDWESGFVITKVPVVVGGNPHGLDPTPSGPRSTAYGPSAVVLTIWDPAKIPQTAVPYIRVPATGFSGTAYTIAGLERELVELVDQGQLFYQNAAAKLAVHQDLLISGTLPIDGDPLFSLANLNCRIRLTHPTKATGLETISGLFTSYKYTFGKRGRQEISMTTDKADLIKIS